MDIASPDTATVAAQLCRIGISQSYASQLSNSKRRPSQKLALRIFRETGIKLGPLANATKAEIDALERLLSKQAA